jgi:hypothetical protein
MTTPKNSRYLNWSREKRQLAWANPKIWHEQLGHIGLAALSKLGQNAIGVRLQGPATTKYQSCAMTKITWQISQRLNLNKATKPFYRIRLDWFDLEEGWDRYQYDGRVIRRCLLMTCEAMGITQAYFTTCAKDNENLPIIRDAINWLHLRYNIVVKKIWSDGKMNQNWTKAWLSSRGIEFKKFTLDMHEQNGLAERMGQVIIEKARAMTFRETPSCPVVRDHCLRHLPL